MRTLKITLLLASLSLLVSSCYKRENWGINGKGESVSETRVVNAFKSIRLACDADVSYVPSDETKLEISAQSNVMSVLRTTVDNGELRIDFDRNVWNHSKIRITVYGPVPECIRVSGSGKFTTTGFSTENLYLDVSGSGLLEIVSLETTTIDADVSGSGHIELNGGKAQNSFFSVSGSGAINAANFTTAINKSNISGSGHIRVNASERINVHISGSGKLFYRGSAVVESDISGSGQIRKI